MTSRRTFLTDPSDVQAFNRRPLRDPSAVRTWCEPMLRPAWAAMRPGDSMPLAGSTRWQALNDDDPRKLAAVLHAALAHLDESTPHAIAARFARELAAQHQEEQALLKETAASLSAAMSTAGALNQHLPFCTLAARRMTYATPPLTADEIRRRAFRSWGLADHPATRKRAA
ncbi:DUF2742 domain-containing protein [Lentzea sp. BCCO 10_0798]|uniref:DUF2742 domain-containing protein n=1 Tax=Lentzea kristufekii TaxID=3095430 RepID=A0ABU4U679_9PSEU|nr:DUF2742 domain-containing protein [Lentzea sp. BCCO 10_0798]MDX8056076.1 DUF2742 domain-containing protein [Lentzea sp. BCCO 10_0798]